MAAPARKKASAKAKGKRNARFGRELFGLGLAALGVFCIVTIFTRETGILGEGLYRVFFGSFGIAANFLPIGLIVAGLSIMLARDEKKLSSGRIALWIVFWLCFTLVSHLPAYDLIAHDTWSNSIADAWKYAVYDNNANAARSAGAVGAMIAYPAVLLLGRSGAWIAAIAGMLGCLLGITRISIKEISARTAKKVSGGIERGQERIRASRERAAKQRSLREEVLPAGIHVPIPKNVDGIADMADYGLTEKRAAAPERDEGRLANLGVEEGDSAKPARKRRIADMSLEEAKEPADDTPPWIDIAELAQDAEPAAARVPEPAKPKKEVLREPISLEDPLTPYHFPPLSLLQQVEKPRDTKAMRGETEANIVKLEETLRSFGVEATVENVTRGPAITRYELRPAAGVRVSRIAGLADDLALNLAAVGVRIEAPIPGKAAVGIEVPNATVSTVAIRDVLESSEFSRAESKIAAALGKDIAGKSIIADLARMPHLLIAGATGSGKSVCINTLIASILFKAAPEEVRMIMIDPKVVELSVFNGVPHLLIPVVTDPKKAAAALQWAVQEMAERYNKFATFGVRDIRGFNEMVRNQPPAPEPTGEDGEEAAPPPLASMPQIVIIIDELADLMIQVGKEVEDAICRLAQLARAAGLHLVIATQRPSVNVITGVIKANIPSRIAFAVASQVDSRTILDMAGAEKLLGKGDMLFHPSGQSRPVRVQGALISDKEVSALVDYVKGSGTAVYDVDAIEKIASMEVAEKARSVEDEEDDSADELLAEATEFAVEQGQIAVSGLQRRFKIGYARAGRLIDAMEQRDIIEGFTGSKPRKVLITREEWLRMKQEPSQEVEDIVEE